MSQVLNLKILLVSRLHTLLLTPPTLSILIGGRGGEKKYKTKNKQKTPKCFNSTWVVTILSIITREICIYFFVPFSLSFFLFLWSQKQATTGIKKKKSQPSERWQRHRCHQDTDKTMHRHWPVLHRWFCAWKASSFNTNYRTVFSGNKKSRSEKAVTHKSINTRTLIFSLQ